MAIMLDGKAIRDKIALTLRTAIHKRSVTPALVIIQIGDHKESNTYVNHKKIFAEKIGAKVIHKKFLQSVTESEIFSDIKKFNTDSKVHGIIIQLPIPKQFNLPRLIEAIDPKKDVDGLTAANTKLLFDGFPGFISAAAEATLMLLEHYKIPIVGKKVVIVGKSSLVGKPNALAFLNKNATVSICHIHTKNLEKETKTADILIVAAGSPKLITKKHVSKGQVVVDIGINVLKTNKKTGKNVVVGDVDFDAIKNIVSAITPVPGGIGPITIAALFSNVVKNVKVRHFKLP